VNYELRYEGVKFMSFLNNIDKLKSIAPAEVQDLYAALNLVCEELLIIKNATDEKIKIEMSNNNFEKARELIDVSAELHKKHSEINDILEKSEEDNISYDVDNNLDDMERKALERPDYDAYSVDDSVAYDLFIQVTFKRPAAFSFKGIKYKSPTWSSMLKKLCELLYEENNELFKSFCSDISMNGKKRKKFTTDKKELRSPLHVSGTDIYIETNLSANDIRKEILLMLSKYKLSSDAVQIYICRDYSALHELE